MCHKLFSVSKLISYSNSAFYLGQKNIVELLLKNGANVNTRNAITRTPLHDAALKGNSNFHGKTLESSTVCFLPRKKMGSLLGHVVVNVCYNCTMLVKIGSRIPSMYAMMRKYICCTLNHVEIFHSNDFFPGKIMEIFLSQTSSLLSANEVHILISCFFRS